MAVITREQASEADYNLSPGRWVGQSNSIEVGSVQSLLKDLVYLDNEARELSESLSNLLAGVNDASI